MLFFEKLWDICVSLRKKFQFIFDNPFAKNGITCYLKNRIITDN